MRTFFWAHLFLLALRSLNMEFIYDDILELWSTKFNQYNVHCTQQMFFINLPSFYTLSQIEFSCQLQYFTRFFLYHINSSLLVHLHVFYKFLCHITNLTNTLKNFNWLMTVCTTKYHEEKQRWKQDSLIVSHSKTLHNQLTLVFACTWWKISIAIDHD